VESLSCHTFGKLQKRWVIAWILLSDLAKESINQACAKSLDYNFSQKILLSDALKIV